MTINAQYDKQTGLLAQARRVREGLDAPWKLTNELRRVLLMPLAHVTLALHGVRVGTGCQFYGLPIVQRYRGSHIELGERVSLRSNLASNPLVPYHPVVLATRDAGASITIGDDTGMTGATLVAMQRIEIGKRVLLGANTTVTDTDFHPLDPARRAVAPNDGASAPVVIENDVFVGMNAIILKGVHIGRGAVIGAGSVVTRDVPSGATVVGNPARVVTSR